MAERLELAGLVACLLAASAPVPLRLPAVRTFPFTYEDDRLYVPVTSAAGAAGAFILDTGSSVTFIDSSLKNRLSLRAKDPRTVAGAGRRTFAISLAEPVSLRVGGTPLMVASAEIGAIDALLRPYSGRRVPGIIGGEFFRAHVVTIDFRRGRVEVRDPSAFIYRGSGIRLPFEFDKGVPVARGRIALADGTILPLRLLVDLGAKANLLVASPFVAEHRLLERLGRTVEAPLGAGLGGETRYAFARLPRLSVGNAGGIEADGLVVGLSVNNTLRGGFYDALLGARFLRRYRLTFDYSRRQIIFEPAGLHAPDRFDRSGAFLVADARNTHRFVVREVLQGSPADRAGLRKDDAIVAVNDRSSLGWNLAALRAALATAGRDRISLSILRAGQPRRVTIWLSNLL